MKKIFLWILKKYTSTESGRIEIMRIMDDKIGDNYNEQTQYGNVYNYLIEFLMANPFVVKCSLNKDEKSLDMLKHGINESFDVAVGYIQKEMG